MPASTPFSLSTNTWWNCVESNMSLTIAKRSSISTVTTRAVMMLWMLMAAAYAKLTPQQPHRRRRQRTDGRHRRDREKELEARSIDGDVAGKPEKVHFLSIHRHN